MERVEVLLAAARRVAVLSLMVFYEYVKANLTWIALTLTALFPRLAVAVAARIFRAMASQFFMAFGSAGFDIAGNLFGHRGWHLGGHRTEGD